MRELPPKGGGDLPERPPKISRPRAPQTPRERALVEFFHDVTILSYFVEEAVEDTDESSNQ